MSRAVLIADDDPPLLGLLRKIVRREPGVDIVVCCNGEEAIRALSERRFDLVFLDLMMPKRNGLEVIEFLRDQRPEQLGVVVVLTAATDQLIRRIDPGAVHAVIEKPFDTVAILDLVHNVLEAANGM